jgi:hypothetical protein
VANAPSRRRPEGREGTRDMILCTDGACSERHGVQREKKEENRMIAYCVCTV